MTNRKKDICQNLERTIFLVLCLFLCTSFCSKSEKPIYIAAQYELATLLHSSSEKAVITDSIQVPSIQDGMLSFTEHKSFSLYNNKFKITAENRNIAQKILVLEQSIPTLKLFSACRFYYHRFSTDTCEIPSLS